ncbi:MAG: hypothetical protein MZU97_24385 [Bacillus subtilis]|nr:hypothetical protein [Bacillus subtilis]
MSYSYLQEMFDEAYYKYPVSKELLQKFSVLDKYVQSTFKIAFGNRIMKQLNKFIPGLCRLRRHGGRWSRLHLRQQDPT